MSTPLTRTTLIEAFHRFGCPRASWRIGGEFERFALRTDGQAVGYDDPRGIRWLLEQMRDRYRWSPSTENGRVIGLCRRGGCITLEPGAQVELSGAPHANLASLAEEAKKTLEQCLNILSVDGTGTIWTALGLTPYATVESIPWVPKGRYKVMREYLPAQGDLATTMMKGTTSFQANYDYIDEADCAEKFDLLQRLSPLFTAMFANSPIHLGKETGFMSTRAHVWTRTDPTRTGFPETVRENYSHEAWVDYLLDAPMMFLRLEDAWIAAEGRSFRYWMKHGIDGCLPSWDDWSLHQTSVFPEVRVKHTLEVRGCDAVSSELSLAGIAMWTALLYDSRARREALVLAREFTAGHTPEQLLAIAARDGLGAETGRPWADWAIDLVDIANRGLGRSEADDQALIEPLMAQVARRESPAATVLRHFRADPRPEVFLPKVAYTLES
jgi:glutamate--cysteine ligase